MSRKKKKYFAISKSRRNAIIVIALLMVIATVWLDRRRGKHFRQAISQKYFRGPDFRKYHNKSFKVVYVIDGDTLDIDTPDGKFDHTRIRLLGIDTPETKNPHSPAMYYGPEATAFAVELALDKTVTVLLDNISPPRDKYGRVLAWVQLPDGGMLNEELLRNGLAYADLRFKNDHFQKYTQLQDQAVRAQTGLWKNVTQQQLPKWLQRMRPDILQQK